MEDDEIDETTKRRKLEERLSLLEAELKKEKDEKDELLKRNAQLEEKLQSYEKFEQEQEETDVDEFSASESEPEWTEDELTLDLGETSVYVSLSEDDDHDDQDKFSSSSEEEDGGGKEESKDDDADEQQRGCLSYSSATDHSESDKEFRGTQEWGDKDHVEEYRGRKTKFKKKEEVVVAMFLDRIYHRIYKLVKKLVRCGIMEYEKRIEGGRVKKRLVKNFVGYPSYEMAKQEWIRLADRRKAYSLFRERGKKCKRKVYTCPGQVDGTPCVRKNTIDLYDTRSTIEQFKNWIFDHTIECKTILQVARKVVKQDGVSKLNKDRVVHYLSSPSNIVIRCNYCESYGTSKHDTTQKLLKRLQNEFTLDLNKN